MPDIRFYNSLTHAVESFEPIDSPRVYMYNCGPTVYDYAHIGNFKTFLFADVLRRFLELAGHDVRQVMNITDVGHMTEDQLADGGGEDKMEKAAREIREAKKQGDAHFEAIDDPSDPYQIARFYTDAFLEDARKLNMKIAWEYPDQMPHATAHVEPMQQMIERLIERGHAYVGSDGAVYYSVESFADYGKLSGNTVEQLKGGAGGRVTESNQAAKKHPADFLLWKPDESHIMKWDSPWGTGYPGWHIECSAMATKVLGRQTIDIHTGGEDNIFPHHECEIAQSRGASGESHFARFWMHSRFFLINGEKMSKSKGNIFTVRDMARGKATGRPMHPAILRFALIAAHYRSNMNLTFKGLQDAAFAVHQLRSYASMLEEQTGGEAADIGLDHPVLEKFVEALSDDLNISGALAAVFEWLKKPKGKAKTNLAVLRQIDSVLGVLKTPELGDDDVLARGPLTDEELGAKLSSINEARKVKDYGRADGLKAELRDAGYEVMDTPGGTVAKALPVVVDE